MFQMRPISLAVHAALGLAAGATALPTQAATDGVVEEIVVTGSRIARANEVTSSPVAQLDAESIRLSGATRIEDVLGQMPQVYLDQSSGQAIESNGTATLQLRGLGNSRTLVLMDGKRLPISSPTAAESGPDLNFIPGAMVERVEVLTGGASAAYGSDAVAGVVNFIMKDDFEGVSFDMQFGQYRHENNGRKASSLAAIRGFDYATGTSNDGDIQDMTFMIGGNLNDGRGNVTAYATYRDIEAITQSERDYSACVLQAGTSRCGGSGTSQRGTFYLNNNFAAPLAVDGTTFRPRTSADLYNFGPPSHYQRPDERYTLGAVGHYEISEQVEAYTQLMFMDNRTVAQFAPAGFFFDSEVDISCANPLLSAQQRGVMGCVGLAGSAPAYIGRRNVEGGPRAGDLRHTTYRGVFGVRGDINEAWSYDVSYQYAEVDMRNVNTNYLDTARIGLALDAVSSGGDVICRAALTGSDPSCVVWNVFQTGGVTQEAVDYLSLSYFERGTTDQTVFTAYAQGDLGEYGVQLPWANNGISIVVGYEQREENLEYRPDDASKRGDIGGLAAALVPVSGGYTVDDYFAEASIPIVEGKRWAESIALDLGYRFSEYDTDAETDTYKIAGSWSPDHQVMLRGSFQRAVRAGNIVELFQPLNGTLFDMAIDPCTKASAGATLSTSGYTFDQCARSGVTLAVWNAGGPASSPAQQYNMVTGGNSSVKPEESDTWSAGFVVSPDFVEGLTVSVDWYNIKVEDAIDNNGEATLIQCVQSNVLCGNVHRGVGGSLYLGNASPTNGVEAFYRNIGYFEVTGVDVETSYNRDIGSWGSLGLNSVVAFIDTWEREDFPGAGVVECQGIYGGICGTPTPEMRVRTMATWSTPWDVLLSFTWRYIDGVDQVDSNTPVDIDDFSFFDVAGIWNASDNISIRFGVNNLADRDPPIVDNGVTARNNGNTYPGGYDHLGQYWFLGGTVQL